MRTVAVIGKNFGDEGKGLAVDYLALHSGKALVVRHNGGAQSGHTVETKAPGRKRFVFHALSAGSLRGAGTLWAERFYPDLFKLGEEVERFRAEFGFVPELNATENTCITVPDDVLLNMALEASRGVDRHGSCGMGINECDLRTKAGYGLRIADVAAMDAQELYFTLSDIRRKYVPQRLAELGGSLGGAASEYLALLSDENVLKNAAIGIIDNKRYVNVLSADALGEKLDRVDTLIFESGQGLRLSCDNDDQLPHVTPSFTGLKNPCEFLAQTGRTLDEVIYVSRTYLTRHGAGPLPDECAKAALGALEPDQTNAPNEWQGALRYAPHGSAEEFVADVRTDLSRYASSDTAVSLFLTHLNETDDCVIMKDRRVNADQFLRLPPVSETFSTFYLSGSRFSEDVRRR